ncbi:hypothetical protein CYY_007981 [Polysphondylium violaceum]|uniref:Pectin lyase-like family protein n=1 Tax=Polysphondylium violaceum TaxID=133409 RepID=A0A8J4PPQ9_9MYCE|nr:hypothetical protein CYY_007981 [Polysphondylium violaceum]
MNNLSFYLFAILSICCCCFISASKADLVLYVDLNSAFKDQQCGNSVQNACVSLGAAYQSYALQTGGSNKTTLTLELLDGVYDVAANNAMPNTNNIYINILNINSYSNNSKNVVLNGYQPGYTLFSYLQQSNQSIMLTISNITFANSYAIVNSTSTLSLTFVGCVFRDINQSAALSLVSLTNFNNTWKPTVAFIDTTFSNISIGDTTMASAIKYTFLLSNVNVNNCSIRSAFFFSGGDGTLDGVTISNTAATLAPISLSMSGDISVMDSLFNNNTGLAGAIYFFDQVTYNALIENSNFTNCKSSSNGGALVLGANSATFKFNNCNFIANSAKYYGGAIYATNNFVNVYHSTISANRAYNGGAVFADTGSNIMLSETTVNSNYATQGGAFFSYKASVTLASDSLSGNSAQTGNDMLCVSSTIGVSPPNAIVDKNYYCLAPCTFTSPENYQCIGSTTGSTVTTTSSSSGGSSTISTSSSTSTSTGYIPYINPTNNDDREKLAVGIGVGVGGFILIAIILLILIRCRSRHHHHVATGYTSVGVVGTSGSVGFGAHTTLNPTPVFTHHHHSGHHHHHGHHGHHDHHHHGHHDHHHHHHTESSSLIDHHHHHHHHGNHH